MDPVGAVFVGVMGALLTLALWPRHRAGREFLRRWHVPEPDDEQIALAVRYLRARRWPIVPIMVLLLLLAQAAGGQLTDDGWLGLSLLGAVLVALLLAEWSAALRHPSGATRTASLVRRRARDLLPGYAAWLLAVPAGLTISLALAGMAAQPAVISRLHRLPPNEQRPDRSGLVLADEFRAELAHFGGWWIVLATVLVAVVVLAVVWRCAVRVAEGDDRIDRLLRERSARVAVGIGIALTGALGVAAAERLSTVGAFLNGRPTGGSASFFNTYPAAGPAFPDGAVADVPGWLPALSDAAGALGLVLLLTGLLGWVWVANPPLRRLAASPK